jgi:hypothetical protein
MLAMQISFEASRLVQFLELPQEDSVICNESFNTSCIMSGA